MTDSIEDLVPDVIAFWSSMEGRNEVICKLNAAITWHMVSRYEVSSDTCTPEAEKVFALWLVSNNLTWQNVIEKFLTDRFSCDTKTLSGLMPHIETILHERPWPFLIPIKGGKA